MWQCTKLVVDGKQIQYAEVRELLSDKCHRITANLYVICAGAVLTPQILFNSHIRPAALGCYLCEQPLAFCQVVLLQELIDKIKRKPEAISFMTTHREDPIPIPYSDPQPQVMTMPM